MFIDLRLKSIYYQVSQAKQLMLFEAELWEPEINLARAKFISGSQSLVSNSISCVAWLIDSGVD